MYFKEGLFKDKLVLVTGGGSGIGKAIAKAFLEAGAKVIIGSRKQEKIEAAEAELKEFGECVGYPLNIRDYEMVCAFQKMLTEEHGNLDILINNAGGQFPSPASNISAKGWRAVIDTNLNGTWNMTEVFGNQVFLKEEKGIVINIIADIFSGFPGMAHTGAARAGVDNLTKSLAVEWARKGIRVNAVAPGVIQSSGLDTYPEGMLDGVSKMLPLKRLGSTEEVAWLVLFLASPMASYITGETIYVDGGSRLWGDFWRY